MTFGDRFHARIEAPHGVDVDVYLLKEGYSSAVRGYSSAVSEMRLATTPIEEQRSKSGSKELVGVRPRMGQINLHPSETAVIEEIYADETPWRIRIERDGQTDVVGEVRKQLRTVSDDRYVTEAYQVKWNDGLGPLKELDFAGTDGAAHSDRKSVIGWITEILRKTGAGLDVAAASEWFTPGMTGSACPLEQEFIPPDRYREDGEPMKCYEVLDDLAKGKGAFVCQERGRWHVYQRSLFRKASFDRYIYPAAWTDASASPSATSYDAAVSATGDFTERLKGSQSPTRKAYSQVDVTYKHETIDNLLPPWYDQDAVRDPVTGLWTTDKDYYWTVDSAFQVTVPPSFTLEDVDIDRSDLLASPGDSSFDGWYDAPIQDFDDTKTVDETLSASIDLQDGRRVEAAWNRLRIEIDCYFDFVKDRLEGAGAGDYDTYQNLGYLQVILEGDDGTTYYLKRQVTATSEGYEYEAPQWTTSEASYVTLILDPDRQQTATCVTQSLPADGAVRVSCFGAIDQQPDALPDENNGLPTTTYRFNLPRVLPVTLSNEQPSEQLVSCRAAGEDADAYEIEVLHGTGPTSAHPGASFGGAATGAPLTDDWKVGSYSGESDTGLTAAQILSREALYQLSRTRRTLDWTFRELRPSLTKSVVLPSGERYLPLHAETLYDDDHVRVEAVRVDRETGVSTSFVTRTSGSSSSSSSSSGGGGGAAAGGASSWPVAGTPEDIFSRSGLGGTVTPGFDDITGALGYTPADETPGTALQAETDHQLGVDLAHLDDRYVLEGGDLLKGDLDADVHAILFGPDGQVQGDGSGAVEVLSADGTNTGVLRVDRAVVNTLEVVDEIDQTNTTNLQVSDQHIVVNEGQTGTPALDGGLAVERGDADDAYMIWDEGTDRWGQRMGTGGAFQPFARTTQDEHISGEWTFDAPLFANDAVTIGGDTFISGALEAYASALIQGGLDVEGGLTASGGASISGSLTSNGGATIDDVGVSGATIKPTYGNALTLSTPYNQDVVLDPHSLGTTRIASGATVEGGLSAESFLRLGSNTDTDHHTDKRTGWGITYEGRADLRGLYADELIVKSFTTDLTQALAGSDYLVKSVATLSQPFTIPSAGNTATLRVNDLPGQEGVAAFEDGDYVRLRVVDKSSGGLEVVDAWGTVSGFTDQYDEQEWTFTRLDNDTAADGKEVGKNAPVLDYGQSGDGLIRRTVEGDNAPYTAIETWTSDPSVPGNYTTRALLGNLDAAPTLPSGTDPSGYGLYSTNAFLKGHIEANTGRIGGLSLKDGALNAGGTSGGQISLAGNATSFHDGGWDGSPSGAPAISMRHGSDLNERIYAHMGETYSAGWTGRFGFSLTPSKGSEALFEISRDLSDNSLTAQIAGWSITEKRLSKDLGATNVFLGSMDGTPILDTRVGFGAVADSGAKAFIGVRSDAAPGAGLYADNGRGNASNGSYFTAGNDHYRSTWGATLFVDGTTILDADEDGAYIDNLDVRGNATIDGSVQIGTRSAAQAVSSDDNILAASDDGRRIETADYNNVGWGYYGKTIDLEARGVSPRDTLSLSFKMKVSGDYGWKMGGRWKDENGNNVATSYEVCGEYGGNGDEWKRYTGQIGVPSGATKFQLRFNASNDATSGTLEAKHFKVNKGPDATDWTPSYKAEGVTDIDGGTIKTGTITADKIDVDDLFAEYIGLEGQLIAFGGTNEPQTALSSDGLILQRGDIRANAIDWVDSGGGLDSTIYSDSGDTLNISALGGNSMRLAAGDTMVLDPGRGQGGRSRLNVLAEKILMTKIPDTDPEVAGQIYEDRGYLVRSQGPPGPEPPEASLYLQADELTVEASGGGSTDPNNDIQAYRFEWGDGYSTGWQPSSTATHTYNTEGSKTITLEVKDSGGRTDSTYETIDVAENSGGGGGGGQEDTYIVF